MEEELTHYELCKKTAERFISDFHVGVFEYQTVISDEHPDVLLFTGSAFTVLFEIKMSREDFFLDQHKKGREKYTEKHFGRWRGEAEKRFSSNRKNYNYSKVFHKIVREAPHLGRERYYVTPSNLIQPDEVPGQWGLFWYKNGRFYLKKPSGTFSNDMRTEAALLIHALRKYWNSVQWKGIDGRIICDNIVVRSYK